MKRYEPYSKTNPFLSKIKQRYSLCKQDSLKSTFHLVLDLEESGLTYEVGDSLGIYPTNDPFLVERTLQAIKADLGVKVKDKTGTEYPLRKFLTEKANITEFSKKLIQEIINRQVDAKKKSALELLFQENNRELLRKFHQDHEVWDLLLEHPEVTFTPQELCDLLMPLLPRFYSIASSQSAVGNEVHLTIALTKYETQGIERLGVCSHYLCHLCPMGQPVVPIYIQQHHGFTLPKESDAALIMIGPGTGIAPFRAFMQERVQKRHKGRNWLFFGEWTRSKEYYYEEDWIRWEQEGNLRVDLAFSREQEEKVYVQHKMLEYGKEFFDWLQKGAYIFVCGDAKHMAKDVDAAIVQIIKTYGFLDDTGVKSYLKELKAEGRYLRDVY